MQAFSGCLILAGTLFYAIEPLLKVLKNFLYTQVSFCFCTKMFHILLTTFFREISFYFHYHISFSWRKADRIFCLLYSLIKILLSLLVWVYENLGICFASCIFMAKVKKWHFCQTVDEFLLAICTKTTNLFNGWRIVKLRYKCPGQVCAIVA